MGNNTVLCPLIDQRINDIECIENADAVDGIIKKDSVPEKYKKLQNWEEICKNCKWHNY